jgi:hypothetical protein
MFLNRRGPSGSNVKGEFRRTCSKSAPLISIAPGSAPAWMRAARLTPSPIKSSPDSITSARCNPKRICIPTSVFSASALRISTAQRSAFTGLAKSARTASPIVLKTRPPRSPTFHAPSQLRSRSAPLSPPRWLPSSLNNQRHLRQESLRDDASSK